MLRWLKRVVSLSLLAGVVALALAREGAGALLQRLAGADGTLLIVALALPWAAVLASAARWQLLLRLEGVERSAAWTLGSFLRGRFVGAFTPSTVGLDLYRLLDAGTRQRGPAGRALLVEKLYGLVALATVSAALLPLGLRAFFGLSGALLVLALGAVSALGVLFLERPGLLERLGGHLPGRLGALAGRGAEALRAGRPDGATRARLLGLGVVTHVATALTFAATGAALGVDASVVELTIVGNAIVLATLLPISVGGVGVREGTAVALLAAQGVGAADAALLAFLGYLCAQPPAVVGGLWQLLRGSSPRPGPASLVDGDAAPA